jgi:cell division protein ZapA
VALFGFYELGDMRGIVMASKTDTEVIIGGRVFTLCGYESEEYLQKVASYINNKLVEYGKVDSFRRQNVDMQNVLLQLNIADDYFKAKKQISAMEEDMEAKEKELYDLKHELIAAQIKLENCEKSLKSLRDENHEKDKKIIRLETELKEHKL